MLFMWKQRKDKNKLCNNGGGSGGGQEEAVELPQAILDVIQNAHLDVDDVQAAGNVAPMVDDDNMPAVKNIPQQDTNNNNNNNNIMWGWQHSGICACHSAIRMNATPMLKSLNTSDEMNDPTNLQLFEALFFKSFSQSTISVLVFGCHENVSMTSYLPFNLHQTIPQFLWTCFGKIVQ